MCSSASFWPARQRDNQTVTGSRTVGDIVGLAPGSFGPTAYHPRCRLKLSRTATGVSLCWLFLLARARLPRHLRALLPCLAQPDRDRLLAALDLLPGSTLERALLPAT